LVVADAGESFLESTCFSGAAREADDLTDIEWLGQPGMGVAERGLLWIPSDDDDFSQERWRCRGKGAQDRGSVRLWHYQIEKNGSILFRESELHSFVTPGSKVDVESGLRQHLSEQEARCPIIVDDQDAC
jgi:hypothetical protein